MTVGVQRLIARKYAAAHGAAAAIEYPHFCSVGSTDGSSPVAALGYRLAGEQRLFLENYLDNPIEEDLELVFGRRFERSRIVEIGAHASDQSRATIALWAHTARHLDGLADVAVAVLTESLRAMFAKIGIPVAELGPADPSRLPGEGRNWGTYYEHRPVICAGVIGSALPRLSRWDGDVARVCK